jgi:hypothetical protein
MWTKLTIELGSIDPLTLRQRVDDANSVVKALMTNKKTNRNHSIWYMFQTRKDWDNKISSQDYIVLLYNVNHRVIEIYKDLGYNLEQMDNMSRKVRRMHYRQLK